MDLDVENDLSTPGKEKDIIKKEVEDVPAKNESKHIADEPGRIEGLDVSHANEQKTIEDTNIPAPADKNSLDVKLENDIKPVEESVQNHTDSISEDKKTNGVTIEETASQELPEDKKKTYRLIIYIDKIRSKPCPRSKKFSFLSRFEKKMHHRASAGTKMKSMDKLCQSNGRSSCSGGCIRQECTPGSDTTIQCVRCNNYCLSNQNERSTNVDNSFIGSQPSLLPRVSSPHAKKHFICDVCETECPTRVVYDKHVRLHVSTDPLFPYKCHKCSEIFEAKEDARQHCFIVHPMIKLQNTVLQMAASPLTPQTSRQKDYRCISCNVTFRNEQAFRNHINSHTRKEGLRCGINDTSNIIPVPNPLTGSQIGILRAIKFTCRVCSKEFDNVGEVDKHTRTHLADAKEEHKCNICKKTFRTNIQLNEHVKRHFSSAHHCPVCSKTFVTLISLKAHLEIHAENKTTLVT